MEKNCCHYLCIKGRLTMFLSLLLKQTASFFPQFIECTIISIKLVNIVNIEYQIFLHKICYINFAGHHIDRADIGIYIPYN